MRRDILAHFLNRDTREIFGVYQDLGQVQHGRLLRQALNAAMVLCEQRCIAPPGFIVEDQIVFELAENQRAYLTEGLLQLPMREGSLAEFAEKKRSGYEPMRDRYSGLFNDTRIGFLGTNATGIIPRRAQITEGISDEWRRGAESGHRLWMRTKELLLPSKVEFISKIPIELNDRGTALTWSAFAPNLDPIPTAAAVELRDWLQHIYLKQYCSEYRLLVLTDIPHIRHDFILPRAKAVYSHRRLSAFLDAFDLKDTILDAPAQLIVELRKLPGFIEFIDAYAGLATKYPGHTDLIYHARRARDNVSHDWTRRQSRRLSLFAISDLEIRELASACGEAAACLTHSHNLPTRVETAPSHKRRTEVTPSVKTEARLVLFVALDEELTILSKQLGLAKNAKPPNASGEVCGVMIDVICPRNMGRVAAAVAMSDYLARRKLPPELIMIVGIAGGFEENQCRPGHIVCVTKVVDLALRKIIDDADGATAKFRRDDHLMDDRLSQVLNSDLFDTRQWSIGALDLGWPDDSRPSLRFGFMASSDEVVASKEWRKQILDGQGGDTKILGTEMEAGGVCAAAWPYRIRVCMLRAISDKADPSKADDHWRALGMKTLADLISKLPLKEVLRKACPGP